VLRGLELAASVVFIAAAIVIKVPVDQRR
jgi:hypothetical protein